MSNDLVESVPEFCKKVDGTLDNFGDCHYMDKASCDALGGEFIENLMGAGTRIKHPEIPERYGGRSFIAISSAVCKITKGIEEVYVHRRKTHRFRDDVSVHSVMQTRSSPAGNFESLDEVKKTIEKMPTILFQSSTNWYGSYDDWNYDTGAVGGKNYDVQEMPDGSLWVVEANYVSSDIAMGPHTHLWFSYHVKGKTAEQLKKLIKTDAKRADQFITRLRDEYQQGNTDVFDTYAYNERIATLDSELSFEEFFTKAPSVRDKKSVEASCNIFGNYLIKEYVENKEIKRKYIHVSEFIADLTKKINKLH